MKVYGEFTEPLRIEFLWCFISIAQVFSRVKRVVLRANSCALGSFQVRRVSEQKDPSFVGNQTDLGIEVRPYCLLG